MKKFRNQFALVTLLLTTAVVVAQAQDKVLQVHSGGSVVYAVNASQVDSITFQDGVLPESLINTKWKLNGIVDAETGAVTELEPKECRDCYTLSFGTDYTAIVNSIFLPLQLNLLDFGANVVSDEILLYEEWYNNTDYEDALDFRKAIVTVGSCAATDDELRLYYNNQEKYLLFKPYINSADDDLNDLITSNLSKQGISDPTRLIGEWDFVTYAYTEDGGAISDVAAISKNSLKISTANFSARTDRWTLDSYTNDYFYDFSLSGNWIKLRSITRTFAPSSPEEDEIVIALNYAYAFVIKDDKLIIYYTGTSDENILILEKTVE